MNGYVQEIGIMVFADFDQTKPAHNEAAKILYDLGFVDQHGELTDKGLIARALRPCDFAGHKKSTIIRILDRHRNLVRLPKGAAERRMTSAHY